MDKDIKTLHEKPYHIVIIEDKIMDLQNFYPAKKLTNGVVQHTLKSGATKLVMPDGIFHVNGEDEFENGFHLIEVYTKFNFP